MIRFPSFSAFIVLASFAVLGAPAARATLLVYEGFDYTIGSRLDTHAPNSATVGLDTAVTYYDGPMLRTTNYTVANGLSFGSLQTRGGALQFTSGTNVIGADLLLASAHTGTLWSSYLVRLSIMGNNSGNGAVIRVGASPADSTGSTFSSWADSRNGGSNAFNVGFSKGGTEGTSAGSLAENTTYIVVSRFTRVGQNIDAGNPGVAQSWALTEAQYAAFILAGGDETALASATVTASASHSITVNDPHNFSSAQAFGIVTVGDAGVYDELRYGSTLASVTPSTVPEPAAASILAGLAATLAISFRRRRD